MRASATSKPDSTCLASMNADLGTRSAWLATSTVRTRTRSAARNRISLICTGHASASTHTTMDSLPGSKESKLFVYHTQGECHGQDAEDAELQTRQKAPRRRTEKEERGRTGATGGAQEGGARRHPSVMEQLEAADPAAASESAERCHRRDAQSGGKSRHRLRL